MKLPVNPVTTWFSANQNFRRIEQSLSTMEKWADLPEQSITPEAPPEDIARLFTRDNGSGKTQLCVRFHTGAIQVISTEP